MHTLHLLLQRAESDRDTAFANCQHVTQTLQAADRQLDQLVNYRRDYEARWNEQFSRLGRMELVRCYQEFTDRLSRAIDQQHLAVQAASKQKEMALQTLRERELRVASVSKLIDRRSREARLADDRQEQKMFDEMAARSQRNPLIAADFSSTH
jgi:flagellar protein FliJ